MTTDKPFSSSTTPGTLSELQKLNDRSRTIFRQIVESYLATGEPVGSRNLARASAHDAVARLDPQRHVGPGASGPDLRPAYLGRPAADRVGLRLFVDGLLEIGDLTDDERRQIEAQIGIKREKSLEQVLTEAGEMISGLSRCAGVVLADKQVRKLKHVEFVQLEPGKALVVLVGDDQSVENRVIDLPAGLPPSSPDGGRQLSQRTHPRPQPHRGQGATREGAGLRQGRARCADAESHRGRVGHLVGGARRASKSLIVRGQANLLKDVDGLENLERIRQLFDDFETKRDLFQLLGLAERGEGVHIFIGSENKLFSLSGSSLIVAPFEDEQRKIVGVLGVIGPTRLNYARIIPMVDYTARLIGRLLT